MKAVVFYGPCDIRVEDVADPRAGENDIVLQVKSCGICGSDVHYYQYGGPRIKPGGVLGHEFSGVVTEVGSGVKDIKVGDRVSAMGFESCNECQQCARGDYLMCPSVTLVGYEIPGGFAEYVRIPDARLDINVFKLSESMTYDDGAIMEPLGVGLRAARKGEPRAEDVAVVLGAGMIGLTVAASFRALGVSKIIVSERSRKRIDAAQKLGVDVVIDPQQEEVISRVMKETSGNGADIAVECAGVPKTFFDSIELLCSNGKMIQVALFEKAFEFNPRTLMLKGINLIGSFGGDYVEAMRLMKKGAIKSQAFVSHSFPLDDAKAAFETQLKDDEAIKVLVKP